MRTLLVGRSGQVGWELERCLGVAGDLVALDRAELDLADLAAVRRTLHEIRPGLILNAAAFTDVEGAESDPAAAFAVNAAAVEALALAARDLDATLIHYSTDYVFDGTKSTPYTEDDAPAPRNVYGRSKLAGEAALQASGAAFLVLRTSWVYAARGRNFLRKILQLAAERERLQVVDDQVGAPTWARFVAEATATMLARLRLDPLARARVARGDVVNLANAGAASWRDFAAAAVALLAERTGARVPVVEGIPTSAYPARALRPLNSRLDLTRLERDWGITAPPWQQSLARCIDELAAQAGPADAGTRSRPERASP